MSALTFPARRRVGLLAAAALMLVALSACVVEIPGTGGGSVVAPNQPPELPRVANQVVSAGSNFTLHFDVRDENPGTVVVTAISSNTRLVANDRIAISASGAARSLVAVPTQGMTGDTFITITARDDRGLTAETVFLLTVR